MAEFKINKQRAQIIQQAEVINVDKMATWDDAGQRLRALVPEVDDLVTSGQVDSQVGAELNAAISEAVVAEGRGSRLRALTRAHNIALGVSILSGVGQVVGEIMQMIQR